MDILSIIAEPGAPGDWLAAYRPLLWVVQADSAVPPDQPMYADVYFGDPSAGVPFVYYKTFTSYTIEASGGFGLYSFDIQDALQEYLKFYIPAFNTTYAIQQSDYPLPQQLTQVIVYFRGSTIDSDGVLTPNPTVPTQGTATTAPISTFSGSPSSVFTIMNATLSAYFETMTDNDLQGFLKTKQVTDSATYFIATTEIYPLSDLPLNRIDLAHISLGTTDIAPPSYRDRQGMFPIMVEQFGISGILPTDMRNCSVYIFWGPSGAFIFGKQILSSALLQLGTYYIPLGLLEMSLLMLPADYANLIDPSNSSYYRIAIYDEDAGKWCFFSPLYKVMATAPQIQTEVLWFQNNYGHFEQVTFVRAEGDFSTSSADQFTPYNITNPYAVGTIETDLLAGHKRYNVRSYDEITIAATFTENLMPWLRELLRSPYVLQEMPKGPGFSFISNPNQLFRAVKILDGSFKVRKTISAAGTAYTITVKIRPAIDNINLRN